MVSAVFDRMGYWDLRCGGCQSFGRPRRRKEGNEKQENENGATDECEPAFRVPNEIQNPQRTNQHD